MPMGSTEFFFQFAVKTEFHVNLASALQKDRLIFDTWRGYETFQACLLILNH